MREEEQDAPAHKSGDAGVEFPLRGDGENIVLHRARERKVYREDEGASGCECVSV